MSNREIIATPPGATIKEQLEDMRMRQKEFAVRMGMSEKHISKLINGEVQLTPDVAMRLELVLGPPARFWNNLEAIYREKIARIKAEEEAEAEAEWLENIPYSALVKLEWIPEGEKKGERVLYLRRYFEVVQLQYLKQTLLPRIVCRREDMMKPEDFVLLAWVQKARMKARELVLGKISVESVRGLLPELKGLAETDAEDCIDNAREPLADCGIALIRLPYIEGSFLYGATFLDGDKIVIVLADDSQENRDRLWFNLFHELAHVLLGHAGQENGTTDADEAAADAFAAEMLKRD